MEVAPHEPLRKTRPNKKMGEKRDAKPGALVALPRRLLGCGLVLTVLHADLYYIVCFYNINYLSLDLRTGLRPGNEG